MTKVITTNTKRRTFLKTVGAVTAGATATTVAGLTLGTCQRFFPEPTTDRLEIFEPSEERPYPGAVRWIPSVCLQCSSACGILVKVVNGKVIKVEGNPLHPVNQGGLCPKGQAGLQVLYHPNRLRNPMKRIGERGSGQWEKIAWDEAITIVAERLKTLRAKEQPQSFVVIAGCNQGLMKQLLKRFLDAFGSPNFITTLHDEAILKANYVMRGVAAYSAYDWDRTKYLLSFENNFLEEGNLVGRMLRTYGHIKERGNRAKIVQIEPRLSVTAARADEWIPVHPGTSGALALGIAHTIIKGGLYDKEFIEHWTFGFDDWKDDRGTLHNGFRTLVLQEYPPDVVARITGIPAETIQRLAREFAITKPAVAIGGCGISQHTNSLHTQMAVNALNALVGSFEIPGGVLTQQFPPFSKLPPVETDAIAERGLAMPRINFSSHLLHTAPYPVDILFLYQTNPLYSGSDVRLFTQVFKEVPFIVSFSSFLDDSAQYADLILPDHTYLERWQDAVIESGDGFPVFGIAQPILPPLYNTMHTGDVIIKIAQELGGGIRDAFPWQDFKSMLMDAVKGVYEVNQGSIGGFSWKTSFAEFWDELTLQGVWCDHPYHFGKVKWEEVFQTPSGKFEFYSQIMRRDAKASQSSSVADDKAFLPHFEPPRFFGDESEYPFHLNPFQTLPLSDEVLANQPWMLEIAGTYLNCAWEPWLEINPQTAQQLGIAEDDWVWMESPLGRIKVRAKIFPGAMPNVVNIPLGFGHKAAGDWCGRGENPYWIIGNELDDLTGCAALGATRVKLYRA